uniref:Uncharacterized protein n=1 Tax=Arundo donax TaxID=35708 RepID=A0A0A9HMK8_ARUDO
MMLTYLLFFFFCLEGWNRDRKTLSE